MSHAKHFLREVELQEEALARTELRLKQTRLFLAHELKMLRLQAGVSLRDAAKAVDCSGPYIHDCENGRRQFSKSFASKLIQHYINQLQ